MAVHIHRNDESGHWSCQGPWPSMTEAQAEVDRTLKVKKKLGEKWAKCDPPFGYVRAWSSTKGDTMYIKED